MWRFYLFYVNIYCMEEQEQAVVVEKKENAPLSFMQRLAYTIIDFGLMLLTAFGLYQICLHTPISRNLHNAQNEMNEIQIQAGESTGFFIKTYLEEGQDTNYTKYEDEGGVYYYTPSDDKDKKTAYYAALDANDTYKDLKFNYTVNVFAITLSCILVSETIFMFVVPLTNKRRATLGILLAGGQVISKKTINRAHWYQMLGRLGFVFILYTCVLYFIGSETLLLIIPLVTLLLTFTNKERRSLHDIVTGVKIIDKSTFVPLVNRDETVEEVVKEETKADK